MVSLLVQSKRNTSSEENANFDIRFAIIKKCFFEQGNSPLLVCAMRNSRDTVREGLSYKLQPFRFTNTQSGALRAPARCNFAASLSS